MKSAIETLEISLNALTTNEPINRAAGNIEQADLEAANAAEIREALDVLRENSPNTGMTLIGALYAARGKPVSRKSWPAGVWCVEDTELLSLDKNHFHRNPFIAKVDRHVNVAPYVIQHDEEGLTLVSVSSFSDGPNDWFEALTDNEALAVCIEYQAKKAQQAAQKESDIDLDEPLGTPHCGLDGECESCQ